MDVTLNSTTTCQSKTSLCWLLGHACPDTAGQADRHGEWGANPAGIAARCHLLERWLRADPDTGRRWRVRVNTGTTAKDGPELLSSSLFPLRFPDDPPGQERIPVAVETVGAKRALAELIVQKVGPVDRPTSLLIGELADALFDMSRDIVRVELSALPEDMCLVGNDGAGRLLSVSFTPTAPEMALEWTDPACLVAGHRCPHRVADPHERARRQLLVRGACAARTLSSALYLTQASYVSFELDAAPHGLDLSLGDPDAADAVVRAGWPAHQSALALDPERAEYVWGIGEEEDEDGLLVFRWPLTKRIDLAAAEALMGWDTGGGPGRDYFPTRLGRSLFRDMVASADAFLCPDGQEPLCYIAGWFFDDDNDREITPGDGWNAAEGASVLFMFGKHEMARIEMHAIT